MFIINEQANPIIIIMHKITKILSRLSSSKNTADIIRKYTHVTGCDRVK